MFFKVTWLTVMVLLILPEKDIARAQNTDLANEESRVSFQIISHLFCWIFVSYMESLIYLIEIQMRLYDDLDHSISILCLYIA